MALDPIANNSLPASDPLMVASAEALPTEVLTGSGFDGIFNLQKILDRIRGTKDLLRLKPFDTSTEQGRSQERYRRAALTTLTSVLARVVTVCTSLLTVRLTIRYLGTERYGMWMTITSVVSFLIFADLGMGNGLVNVIADAHGRDDDESVRKYVSSAFFVLLGIALLLLGILALAYPYVPWPHVFNVSSSLAARESGPAVFVFLACFLLNLPLDVVQRLQAGYQEGYATNFWTAAGALLGLGNLLVAIHLHRGLPFLILAILGGQIVGVLGNWGQAFGWKRRGLLPRWGSCDSAAARRILGTGVWFFIIQACSVFMIPLDNIVITQILGPDAVTQFSVPMRLFILVSTVAAMFVIPLWPAYGEAAARGDVGWIKSTFYHSLVYNVMVFGPASLGLALLGRPIMHIWVGQQIQPSHLLLFGMAAWTILAVAQVAINTCLTGINALKFQATVAVGTAISSLVLKVTMAKAFGLPGVVWAGVLVMTLGTLILVARAHWLLRRGHLCPARNEPLKNSL